MTPRGYAERQRLGRSMQLLEVTLLPVNEVARQAGFENQFYFAARFKKLTGRSPSAFRFWKATAPPSEPKCDERRGEHDGRHGE